MKNLNEELNKMRRLMDFDISENSHDVLSESNIRKSILSEAVTYVDPKTGKELGDKFFLITYKGKKKKPKLIELGYCDAKMEKFYPTKQFGKYWSQHKNKEVLDCKQVLKDTNFKRLSSKTIENSFGVEELIIRDYEIDEFIDRLLKTNQEYNDLIEKRVSASKGSNWGDSSSGTIMLEVGSPGTYVNAYNIKLNNPGFDVDIVGNNFNMMEAEVSDLAYAEFERDSTSTGSTITLDDFSVNDQFDTYCDNMVQVNVGDSNTLKELKDIVRKIKIYIESPDDDNGVSALSKLNNITILGQADAAAPGWLPGSPCNSATKVIDHNYGGIPKKKPADRTDEDKIKMNTYLAKHRAINYKNLLIQKVKEDTGKDITIKELPPKQYYGKGSSFRGSEWRSIRLSFNAPVHNWTDGGNKGGKTGWEKLKEDFKQKGFKWGFWKLYTTSGSKYFEGIQDINSEEVWVIETTNYGDKNIVDVSSLPKLTYSIKASMEGPNLKINTSMGDVILKGATGLYGDVWFKVSQSAMQGGFIGKCDKSQMSYTSIDFQIPNQNSYNCYDKTNAIKILNKKFYKLKQLSFVLTPASCAWDKSKPPTKEQIIRNMVSVKPVYTEKQMSILNKQLGKTTPITTTKSKKTTNSGDGESIQQDIQLK
tara:strand:+ start:486 stop:2432 length:1947 start_codon:yes stop_codon:yes gene_type:complete